jgi:uncharacterized protein
MDGPSVSQTPETDQDRERVDPKLLEILVCPLTKTALEYDAAGRELISRAAGLAYPIRNGVPLMTVEAARPLDAPRATDTGRPSQD